MRGWTVIHFGIWLLSIIATASVVVWLNLSVQAGVLVAVAITFLWAAYLSYRYFFRQSHIPSHATELSQPDRSESYREAQIESLRLGFEKVVTALKDSKLKGPRGDESPWFLVIGPPRFGKNIVDVSNRTGTP